MVRHAQVSTGTILQPTSSRLCGSGGANAEKELIGLSFLLFLSHVAIIYQDCSSKVLSRYPHSHSTYTIRCSALLHCSALPRSHRSLHFFLPPFRTLPKNKSEKKKRWLSAPNSRTPTSRQIHCRLERLSTNKITRVGVFSCLTNAYAIVAVGGSENFYRYAPAKKGKKKSDNKKTDQTLVSSSPNSKMSFPSVTPLSPVPELSVV